MKLWNLKMKEKKPMFVYEKLDTSELANIFLPESYCCDGQGCRLQKDITENMHDYVPNCVML
jgi:hypothetical protein